jgi:hypothetical protein
MRTSRLAPPPHHSAASVLHRSRCFHAAFRPLTVQERYIAYTVGSPQAKFIRMKSASKKRTPSIVNLTVKRRYLMSARSSG